MSIELKSLRTREDVLAFNKNEKSWTKAKGFDLRWDGGVVYITQNGAQAIVPLSNVASMEPVLPYADYQQATKEWHAQDMRPAVLVDREALADPAAAVVRRGPGRPKKTPPEAA